jgi:gamma-glutamyltranspeptidase/glutathione hydrolase
MKFISRRSPVYASHGMVASSQPLASMAGLRILQAGGNAADAAIATAAALNVTEPTSTGIGGDCFCLYYDADKGRVLGLNGSGRAPAALTPGLLNDLGYDAMPRNGVHTVTVPGAASGWIDTLESFGSMTLGEVLGPAITLGEEGFPVAPLTARLWNMGVPKLKSGPHAEEMLIDGRAPRAGELMRNPTLARTFRTLAEHGKPGFYEGRIAEAIEELLGSLGGVLTTDDLKSHRSTYPEPISVDYKGTEVYEIPPNSQGITALIALNILEEYDWTGVEHSSVRHLHTLIEAMRLAFADSRWYVADPDVVHVPIEELISKEYATERRRLLNPERASVDVEKGSPVASSDTVYFCTVDGDGNACSFINSNYGGFGTGLIFTLEEGHPNRLEPGKRPYHTIIPGMMLRDGLLHGPFGVMGGFTQPQGHVQMVVNMVDYGMGSQEALDAPRFTIISGTSGGRVLLEDSIPVETISALAWMGHEVVPSSRYSRGLFGRGQIIIRDPETGVLCGGSEPRADGQAVGW